MQGLNQRAVAAEVADTYRVSGVEGAPESAKHLKPDLSPTIARRSHFLMDVQAIYHWAFTPLSQGKTAVSRQFGDYKFVTTLTLFPRHGDGKSYAPGISDDCMRRHRRDATLYDGDSRP